MNFKLTLTHEEVEVVLGEFDFYNESAEAPQTDDYVEEFIEFAVLYLGSTRADIEETINDYFESH